jgi:hypothetical protein
MVFKSRASRPGTFKLVLLCFEYNLAEEFLLMAVIVSRLAFLTHEIIEFTCSIFWREKYAGIFSYVTHNEASKSIFMDMRCKSCIAFFFSEISHLGLLTRKLFMLK